MGMTPEQIAAALDGQMTDGAALAILRAAHHEQATRYRALEAATPGNMLAVEFRVVAKYRTLVNTTHHVLKLAMPGNEYAESHIPVPKDAARHYELDDPITFILSRADCAAAFTHAPMRDVTPEALAWMFHRTYEALAPLHGYETRRDSAKPWADIPAQNKGLMIAVAEAVLTWLKTGAD